MTVGAFGARMDRGGLGAQFHAFHEHVRPDYVVALDLGPHGRGPNDLGRYPGAEVAAWPGDVSESIDRLLSRCDTVFGIETFYVDDFAETARRRGVRTVQHVNPELWKAAYALPDEMWVSTTWEMDRLPMTAKHMPWPVDRVRFPFRQRLEARTFYHCSAPAFHDRSGTDLVFKACRYVRQPITLLVRGRERTTPRQIGRVTVRNVGASTADNWSAWPDDADVLLHPRRYAGGDLLASEAASLGLPVVTLDVEPHRGWVPDELRIPAHVRRQVRMIGGDFPVHDADPRALAAKIDHLATHPEDVARLSVSMNVWADSISWDRWAPRYREMLGC